MKVNGKRISIQKFWQDFNAPEIDDLEDLYESHVEEFMKLQYQEDAWCYVQDYMDGILIRFFLLRRFTKRRQKNKTPYYEYGKLTCNREVKQVYISKDGAITYRVNGFYFRCFEGLIFTNAYDYKKGWVIRKNSGNSYYQPLEVCVSDIVYGKCDHIKYVIDPIEKNNWKLNSKNEKYMNTNLYMQEIARYLSNNLYEITYKMGEFCEIPKNKKLTPKILINACKSKILDRLGIMLDCNSTDYESFKKIETYRWNAIQAKLKENTNYKETFPKFTEFMIKYAKNREEFSTSTYNDYLQNLLDLNIEFNEKNLLNKDFVKDHERMYARVQEVKNKEKFDGYKRFAEKNKMFEAFNFISDKNYSVIIPTELNQYISEAEQNHNCVYKNDYWKKMAKKECFILFVRKNEDVNKSYLTVELDMNYRVVQCYQDHNAKADYEGRTFVENLAMQYKEKNLFKNLKGVRI